MSKSVEKEKERLNELKNSDLLAYNDIISKMENHDVGEVNKQEFLTPLSQQDQEKDGTIKRPNLFTKSANDIVAERKKHKQLLRQSTFKATDL